MKKRWENAIFECGKRIFLSKQQSQLQVAWSL